MMGSGGMEVRIMVLSINIDAIDCVAGGQFQGGRLKEWTSSTQS